MDKPDQQQPDQQPYEATLRAELLKGASVDEAAHLAGVSSRTAQRWTRAHRMELAVELLQRSGVGRFLVVPTRRRALLGAAPLVLLLASLATFEPIGGSGPPGQGSIGERVQRGARCGDRAWPKKVTRPDGGN